MYHLIKPYVHIRYDSVFSELRETTPVDSEKPLLSCRPRVVADTVDASIVSVARLRRTAIPTTASPGAVAAVSANTRVSRLAWNGTAAVPTLATRTWY
jgi:hypothetical protein